MAVAGNRALARIRHNLQPRALNASLPGIGGLPGWVKGLATFPLIVGADFYFEVGARWLDGSDCPAKSGTDTGPCRACSVLVMGRPR